MHYTITIDMNFEDTLDIDEMELLVYSSCTEIFNNFKNITVKIVKDEDTNEEGHYKSTTKSSIKNFNMDTNNSKYDF